MKPAVRRLGSIVLNIGLDPRRLLASLRFLPSYLVGAVRLHRSSQRSSTARFTLRWLPALSDRYTVSGDASGHYFHQDLWAARRIYEAQPKRHIDVGSRIDGFVAHLLVFREVEIIDVRKLDTNVSGLHFCQADLMRRQSVEVASTDSLSCLHALEHIGLGRYGDPIDYDGWYAGLQNLTRMLYTGGQLYLSVPVGPQVIEFNAHRIFAPVTIVKAAEEFGLQLIEFSYVDDAGNFHERSSLADAAYCQYGCGCFLFKRLA